VLGDARLHELADRLTGVRGVAGVVLGGSRARGTHTPESDVDLGVYYRPPLDTAALGELARRVAGPDARVTEPGEWGPWVDGGGWLRIDGTAVDWIYRDADRVHRSWRDAQQGRFSWHAQTGHPLGVPDFAYAGEIALAVVLADPAGELTALQRATQDYPAPLRDAVVAGLWEAGFCLEIAAKAVGRGDHAYVSGCLFRAVLLCAHALHAVHGRWLIAEKGAVEAAGRLPGSPPEFAARAQALFTATPDLPAAHRLLAGTRAACAG
jgi:predicted nucleotidyltransferase